MHIKLSLLAALVGLAIAAPSRRSPHVLHEKRAADPVDWVLSHRLDANKVLPMRFGLSQQNLHKVEEMLMSVSHPESPNFGQHFTPEEIIENFAPSKETVDNVINWLADSGISRDRLKISANKGWVSVDATTAEVEELLNTEYHVYTHTETGAEQFGMFYIHWKHHPRSLTLATRLPQLLCSCSHPSAYRPHQTHCTV